MRPVFLGLAILAAACTPHPGEPPVPKPAEPAAVFVAGEERGYLEPCGCTRPQLGGLARKATALGGSVLFENGDLVDRPGRLSEIKYETFLLALSEIGCQALNIGERDLSLGLEFLQSAAGMARFPLISANLSDESGERPFPGSADVRLPDRLIRVIGVLDPTLAPEARLGDPSGAVRREIQGAPAGAEIVLLFHGTAVRARALFGESRRVSHVVCAHGDGEPDARDARFVSPGDRSRWMIRLAGGASVVELSEEIQSDPRMERSLATYVSRITAEDLLHRMNPQAPPAAGGFTGDAACAPCHENASTAHSGSLHAAAIEPLRKTGREVDPDCVTCHVVGYGERTGFLSVAETPALARVGCESCHGPGRDHGADPNGKPTSKDAKASCRDCHTEDTDPTFDFDHKWRSIRHD